MVAGKTLPAALEAALEANEGVGTDRGTPVSVVQLAVENKQLR